jgi:hypothetical protein
MSQSIVFRFTRSDQAASHYHYVPFEVPQGTTRIEVAIDYERCEGICSLDFGLIDGTATDFPSTSGLIGWTGSARSEFFTALDDATPGYLYGAIVPGTWKVLIGLSDMPEEGVEGTVHIRLDSTPRSLKAQPKRTEPVRKGAGWYKGDLHCHTFHSDADGAPETLHAQAKQAGLDFLAVADHNTITQRQYFYPASSPDLVFVRGTEVSTFAGHANAFGVEGMVDYRLTRPEHALMLSDHVHELGGILSLNHDKPTIPWRWELPRIDCMEVWQSTWIEWNWISLARYQARLAAGLRISAIGGSDYHQPIDLKPESPFVLARPTTVLWLEELSEAAIIKAIKSGHGYITEDPSGPHLSITAYGKPMGSLLPRAQEVKAIVRGAPGDQLVWIDASGEIDSAIIEGDEWTVTLPSPERATTFIRAEIIAEASYKRMYAIAEAALPEAPVVEKLIPIMREQRIRRAISNPIYFGY